MTKTFNDWMAIFDDKNSSDKERIKAKQNMIQLAESFHDWQEVYVRSSSEDMKKIRDKLSELKEIL